ncbi:MAG: ribosomal protein S18-alanine N-acetyltransferase [Firmicutes bacterium]|nr:ribosomal protein S18-alanine N-acetyltransferase [Bacillota bacterium]
MTKADAEELAELDRRCFSVPWSKKSFEEEAENSLAVYFVARDGKMIVAYSGFWRVCGQLQITNVAVLPEFRRKGIASTLVKKIIEEAKDAETITLEVRESNEPAIRLYERFSFKRMGVRKNFYRLPRENALIMTRGEL